jgi:hypothetical protein
MTWPTSAVSTQNLDAGSDNPGLARPDLKSAVDNINSVAAEFGNVSVGSATTGQVLTLTGNVWTATTPSTYSNTNVASYLTTRSIDTYSNANVVSYLTANPQSGTYGNTQVGTYLPTYTGVQNLTKYIEPVYTSSVTTGNVVLDFANGNHQILTPTGNITLGFTGAPSAATMTVIFATGAASRAVTFANTVLYAGNVRTVSTTTSTTDIIIATTVDAGSTYLVSIVKGFVA